MESFSTDRGDYVENDLEVITLIGKKFIVGSRPDC